jgi:glycosyltransferase involved in cell wall biosynthesis
MDVTAPSRSITATAADRLRVLHVVRSLDMGGQEMMLCRLAAALDRSRFEVAVASLQPRGPLAERLEESGIPVHCLGGADGLHLELIPALAGLFRRFRPDVVHCHNFQPFLYAGLASVTWPRARLMATAHGFRTWKGWRLQSVVRWLMRRARAIVAVTPEMRGYLAERGAPDARLRVIVNGIDTESFAPVADRATCKAELGITPGTPVIGAVGRLSPEKDHANLVRAMETVLAHAPNALLLLAGDGALRPDLEALARDRGVAHRVRFLGECRDVKPVLGALHVYCLPSQTEGTSLALLEAMACALPIVATAVGGTPAVVDGGEAALLVPPMDPVALGTGILELMGDPGRAAGLGAKGRAIVEARYSLRQMAGEYARLYESLRK